MVVIYGGCVRETFGSTEVLVGLGLAGPRTAATHQLQVMLVVPKLSLGNTP